MNRILNLKVLPAVATVAFFLITCSNNNEVPSDPVLPPVGGLDSPSSSAPTQEPESSSSPEEGGDESSSSATAAGSPGTDLSSSSDTDDDKEGVSSSSTRSGSSSSVRSGSSSSSRSSSSVRASSSSVRSSSSVAPPNPPPPGTPTASFTETVGSVSFDMIYIPGGTFTIGCEASSCPADTKPVSGVQVSNYLIGKTEVTNALWKAVMGSEIPPPQYASNSGSATHITWYDAMEFACKLSNMTGRKYRMPTEAEWEYAAKNYIDKLEKINSSEEWAYNSWNSAHMGGTDPVGPSSGLHTQKTRRDASGTGVTDGNITGRLIRSIEGTGPALRLAISSDMEYPPAYVSPCDLHAPKMEGEPVNSYRDMRWVTGDDAVWAPPTSGGQVAAGSFQVRVWEDGTAQLTAGYGGRATTGQWFTSNNIAFVFVPSSGSLSRYGYIFLDDHQGSLVSSDKGFMDGGFIGRIEKREASHVDKPTVADLKSGEALAKAQADFETLFKMVDMEKLPKTAAEITSAYKQDARLLDGGADKGWFQDNTSSGGVHHYRKDVDPDEFRFTVNQGGNRVMLANGKWFTVNNIFLRVIHEKGYTADYLYSVSGTGDSRNFYHDSFMGYERGDFRMFKIESNNNWPKTTCPGNNTKDICAEEIPKGLDQSMYNSMANGKSTFVPAPCPTGGCPK